MKNNNQKWVYMKHFFLRNYIRTISLYEASWEISTHRTKHGSLRPLTMHSCSYFSFFLEGHKDFTKLIPAWVFFISQYGESVSIMSLSTGIPLKTSRFSAVFSEQPFTPIGYKEKRTKIIEIHLAPKWKVIYKKTKTKQKIILIYKLL